MLLHTQIKRYALSRIAIGSICILISAISIVCSNSSDKSEKKSAVKSPKIKKNQNSKKTASLATKLGEAKKVVKEAIRAKDFSKARHEIQKTLAYIEQAGEGIDIERAGFLLLLGNVEREQGREVEARRDYDDAMAVFHVNNNAQGKVETFLELGALSERDGDYAASKRSYTAAEELLPEVQDKTLMGLYHKYTARLASRQVDHTKAKEGFEKALHVFQEIGDKQSTAECLLLLAAEEDGLERGGAATTALNRARAVFQELGDLDGEAQVIYRLAVMAERDKSFTRAKKLYEEVLELYKKLDRSSAAAALERHLSALPEPE